MFVIGDIHGCLKELQLLLHKLPLKPDSIVIFIGDYVDRGSRSSEVIETILELRNTCHVIPLMGNHEAMFLDFLDDPQTISAGLFIQNGGSSTLASYADKQGQYSIPHKHIAFLRELELFYETDYFFFAHAGVPDLPLDQIDPRFHRHDLLWTRSMQKTTFQWAKRIIHGHTAQLDVEMHANRINIDTGCVFSGKLTALELPSMRLYSVKKQDPEKRVYLRDPSSRRKAIRFPCILPVSIHVGEQTLQLETINHSEVGMLVRAPKNETALQNSEIIQGRIGQNDPDAVEFKGEVARKESNCTNDYYGIKILSKDTKR